MDILFMLLLLVIIYYSISLRSGAKRMIKDKREASTFVSSIKHSANNGLYDSHGIVEKDGKIIADSRMSTSYVKDVFG